MHELIKKWQAEVIRLEWQARDFQERRVARGVMNGGEVAELAVKITENLTTARTYIKCIEELTALFTSRA